MLKRKHQLYTKSHFAASFKLVHYITLLTPILFSSFPCRQNEGGAEDTLVGAELLLQRQEEEVQRLQAHMAHRLSRANLYPTDDPLALQESLYTSSVPPRKLKVCTCSSITDVLLIMIFLAVLAFFFSLQRHSYLNRKAL